MKNKNFINFNTRFSHFLVMILILVSIMYFIIFEIKRKVDNNSHYQFSL